MQTEIYIVKPMNIGKSLRQLSLWKEVIELIAIVCVIGFIVIIGISCFTVVMIENDINIVELLHGGEYRKEIEQLRKRVEALENKYNNSGKGFF